MNNVKNLIEKIKKEGIKPKPKWQFVLKNFLFWALFGLSVLLGTAALSIIIHSFGDSGMGLASHLYHMRFKTVLEFFPIYWLILFILFVITSYFGITNTKKGYKYSHSIVVLGVIICSIILGSIIYSTGNANRIEVEFLRRMPMYESMEVKRDKMWDRVEDGFLRGRVNKINNMKILHVKDPRGYIWKVDNSDAKIFGDINVDSQIRAIGKKLDNGLFKASEIRVWIPGRKQGEEFMHIVK